MKNSSGVFEGNLIWEGKEVKNIGDIIDIIVDIANRNAKREAELFLDAYGALEGEKVAKHNVNYLTGYLSTENRKKVKRVFFSN